MPIEIVIDTMVLQKANATIVKLPKERSRFKKRLALLKSISDEKVVVVLSQKLLAEYKRKLPEPRNDYIGSVQFFSHISPRSPRGWATIRSRGGTQDVSRSGF